jgi:4-hydroxyphenylpyruvate dioxygenase-like putative hemolysin
VVNGLLCAPRSPFFEIATVLVRLDEVASIIVNANDSMTASDLSHRTNALDIAARVENANLACAKACAMLRIIDCLIFREEHGSTPGASKLSIRYAAA